MPRAIAHIATIGARYGSGGRRDRPDPGRFLDQQRAVLGEVAREEHDEDHLQQLGRLAADRAERERQALAVDLGPEHERQQQERDAGGRPGVLVEPQPAIGADDDRERGRDADRQDEPDELDVGQAELGAEEALDDEILRQPFHQQQADPAEQPDRGQQHLVGPSPGQHLGEMGRHQHPEIDREMERLGWREAGGRRGLVAVPGEFERNAAGQDRGRDDREQTRLPPSWPGLDLAEDPGERRSARRHRRGRSSRNRTWPTWISSP